MRKFHKLLLGGGAIAVLVFGVVMFLYSHAPDFWGYGKLGVSDGTAKSPIFFVEVRGVGQLPTVAYIVRCPDDTTAPKNRLEVSQTVIPEFEKRTRVVDRWRSECILFVGRNVGEAIPIPLDRATAKRLFAQPGTEFGDIKHCQEFWDKFASPRLVEYDRSHPGSGKT